MKFLYLFATVYSIAVNIQTQTNLIKRQTSPSPIGSQANTDPVQLIVNGPAPNPTLLPQVTKIESSLPVQRNSGPTVSEEPLKQERLITIIAILSIIVFIFGSALYYVFSPPKSDAKFEDPEKRLNDADPYLPSYSVDPPSKAYCPSPIDPEHYFDY